MFFKYSLQICIVLVLVFSQCSSDSSTNKPPVYQVPSVLVTSAMKNVMWKGELGPAIRFDTVDLENLYGVGPLAGLRGEVLIKDGVVFSSVVLADSSLEVRKSPAVASPFFVRTRVQSWTELAIPAEVATISELEKFIAGKTLETTGPFAFQVRGLADSAVYHCQNLPEGSVVSNPKEAHAGQVSYTLSKKEVVLVGFYSTSHKGIFTHHDSNVHIHLITADEQQMGHLDKLSLGKATLYLPKK